MRAALAAMMRAREAERVYLRGRTAAVVVDLKKVRLAGATDSAGAAGRVPRSRLSESAARQAERFDAALVLLHGDPAAAIDSLSLLRIDALGASPEFASALAAASAPLEQYLQVEGAGFRHLPIGTPACTGCGYNLTGNISGTCPECGKPVDDAAI